MSIPTSTKNKKPSQKHKADEDNIVSMGCRGLGGILVGFFGLQALSNGWVLAFTSNVRNCLVFT